MLIVLLTGGLEVCLLTLLLLMELSDCSVCKVCFSSERAAWLVPAPSCQVKTFLH